LAIFARPGNTYFFGSGDSGNIEIAANDLALPQADEYIKLRMLGAFGRALWMGFFAVPAQAN
jgi:hypothetical protein